MIKNTNWVYFAILLTIFRYNLKRARLIIPHVHCDGNPAKNDKYNIEEEALQCILGQLQLDSKD